MNQVLIYARVSTSDKGQNPKIQTAELMRFCAARGWKVAEEITDHGYSGSSDSRPGLNRLMDLVRQRKVDTVVVVKLDRLFRSLKHLVTTLDEFKALGVGFVAVKDNVDYSTPSGRFFVQILGSLAEFEKELLRERTMMGLDHARRTGKRLGRPRTRDDMAILQLRSQGLSYTQIQSRLKISRGAVYRALRAVSKTPSKPSSKRPVISRSEP